MLKNLFSLIILSLLGLSSFAQSNFDKIARVKPDFEKIKADINNRNSDYYYPRLMEEFQRNDTLMKLDKYRYLYLGYAMQEDYNPYRSAAAIKSSAVDIERARLTKEECAEVIKAANAALENDPFDLQHMAILIAALRQDRQANLAKIWQYKLNYILMAIISTGTGVDEDNAWYVIEPQHEYMLLNMMGFTVTNHLFYEPNYEYLTVVDSEGNKAGGYYFNIRPILEEYYRKFPDSF